jgi:methionyl-tRNA synthetase
MAAKGPYYLTTPIYYLNDVPHVGHAYTTIAADALTRARRLIGREAFLLTGTDEHGQNIERIARERGKTPKEHCDELAARFRDLWGRYHIRYDSFIRTTDDVHKRGVLALWERLRGAAAPNGRPAIYRAKYAGWYCPRCEGFKAEDELRQPGNVCPDHERPCEWTEEENLFFRLSAFSSWLEEEISSLRLRIDPVGRRNEVLSVIRQGLQDFSVSRARVRWGIPVPDDPGHVFYVWMDALANYVTALGFADGSPDYERYWAGAAERFHLVGKEIIRFHCLYWPAMLKAAGLPAPTRVFAHGHLTKNGRKLSKTTGNVIDPEALLEQFGPDAVRYFLLREGSFGQDWDFTDEGLVNRYNADLANDFGNLVSRALAMVHRYRGGKVPDSNPVPVASEGRPSYEYDSVESLQLPDTARKEGQAILERYEQLDFAGALQKIWSWVSNLNLEIARREPWEMAKEPARQSELDSFLYWLLDDIRLLTVWASPVMPAAAVRVFEMLGLTREDIRGAALEAHKLLPGAVVGKPQSLFPRIEKERAAVPEPTPPSFAAPESRTAEAAIPAAGEKIDIAEFAKIDLRVALVTAAEKIAGSKKLVKMQVDLGSERRQIVAGIADAYEPEALIGRKVALVANLKPAKLMGVESNGMVLAASIDGKAVLCTFDADVPPGTKIK